jgi:beta-glucosidase
MKALGTGAYRFSVCWPRVIPGGIGPVSDAGLDFYSALVDRLLEKGIEPWITLYHWELPQALQDKGGWAARDTAKAFVDYADTVVSRLGDRVTHWMTHNEPWCVAHLGHEAGEHAPGHQDPEEALRVAHHVLLSHGMAVPVIRDRVPNAKVGIVLNLTPAEPISQTPADIDAARWFDGWFNRWYLDPVFRGRYPDDAIADRIHRGHLDSRTLPFVWEGDMKTISNEIDMLGVNYYSRAVMQVGTDGRPEGVRVAPDDAYTEVGWEVYPQGLHDLLTRLKNDYNPKEIYITENGAAYGDGPDETGRVHDHRRIEYMQKHLATLSRAIEDGVPVNGYFAWSAMDNFEWAYGYTKRFGLYWVDFETQQRIAKDSAHFYREVIASNTVDGEA